MHPLFPPTSRFTTPHRHPVLHTLCISVRCMVAMFFAILLAPLTAAAFVKLPFCVATRVLEYVAVLCVRLIGYLGGVECVMRPRSKVGLVGPTWLRAPLVRFWTSPLPRGRCVTTYDQPGRWMGEKELEELGQLLMRVAERSIGVVPNHRLFQRDLRQVLQNRVVSVVFDSEGALGFTAMVYLPVEGDTVVHLGLTMIAKRGRGQRLQSSLFTRCLLVPVINLGRMEFFVTNLGASPAGMGNFCNYFFDVYPRYDEVGVRKEVHVRIARVVLKKYRQEFGCSRLARFDERKFVVYGSNVKEGGGTCEFIKKDGIPVSCHKDARCNEYVGGMIDFRGGDEIFQVGRMNCVGSAMKYLCQGFSNGTGHAKTKGE